MSCGAFNKGISISENISVERDTNTTFASPYDQYLYTPEDSIINKSTNNLEFTHMGFGLGLTYFQMPHNISYDATFLLGINSLSSKIG